MTKRVTTDDLFEALPKESQERVNAEVNENVRKWGGLRENSGRTPIVEGKILKFTKRLTEEEARFIDYAREHHINYDDLMQGSIYVP